jgi:hypothetical protein
MKKILTSIYSIKSEVLEVLQRHIFVSYAFGIVNVGSFLYVLSQTLQILFLTKPGMVGKEKRRKYHTPADPE